MDIHVVGDFLDEEEYEQPGDEDASEGHHNNQPTGEDKSIENVGDIDTQFKQFDVDSEVGFRLQALMHCLI